MNKQSLQEAANQPVIKATIVTAIVVILVVVSGVGLAFVQTNFAAELSAVAAWFEAHQHWFMLGGLVLFIWACLLLKFSFDQLD